MVERFYSETPTPQVTSANEITAASLIQAHAEAMGGDKAVGRIDLLRFSGSVFKGDEILTFEGTSSRSDRFSVVLSDRDSQRLIQPEGFQQMASLVRLGASQSHNDYLLFALGSIFADFENLAHHHPFVGRKHILSVEPDKFGKKGLLCVTLEMSPDTSSILYLNEDSMRLEERRDLRDGEVTATYRYSDYEPVNGVPLPHSVVAQISGYEPVRLHFRSLRAADPSSENKMSEGLARHDIN